VRGGQVHGRWPGLEEAELYDRRDLMPTTDIRAWAAWAMRESFGVSKSTLEGTVFGNLDMGAGPKLLL
ncbi:MAG: twin-arginine translocation pathway signal, partial [Cognatishimia sp.]|nr:twin-arginine translocation pathway signal [Cognatishimia sp.]